MQRYLSIGSATLVALMAAHREAAGHAGTGSGFNQDEVARIETYLRTHDTTVLDTVCTKPAVEHQ